MIITTTAYGRAGMVGNPSDGYFGKTISFIVRNFSAKVSMWESPHFEIVTSFGDFARFESMQDFLRSETSRVLRRHAAGQRRSSASTTTSATWGFELQDRSCTISYTTDIPRLVGLAGSSDHHRDPAR
jgi:glucuronokinase